MENIDSNSLDPNSSKPLYRQAEEMLRRMIAKEEYISGKLLPNEVELSKQLGISRNTLRQAIDKLVFEGLLIRKKGYGTKVAKRDVLSNAKNWMSFSQEMQALGIEVHNFELSISRKYPSNQIANFFGIAATERLVVLERVRGKKDFPFVYFISYFNPVLGFNGDETFSRPLYEIIEKDKGHILKTSREEISCMSADTLLAQRLEIKVGDPVLVRKRFVLDINDIPIEYNIGYYRADSFTYTIECVR